MDNHLFFPLLVPLFAALLTLFAGRRHTPSALVLLAVLLHLAYSIWLVGHIEREGRQVTQVANWQVPQGISLVADGLSALMLVLVALITGAVVMFSLATLDRPRQQLFYYPLVLMVLFAVSGVCITGDLFSLYIWLELVSVGAFGLLTLGSTREQVRGGLHYVVLNLVGSCSFLVGCGLVYGVVGTLNLARLSDYLATTAQPGIVTALAGFFLVGCGLKAGIFPLFFWLPDSYQGPPVAITVLAAGLFTEMGIYALYRIFGLLYQYDLPTIAPLVLLLAAMTMLMGVAAALAQKRLRRVLSFVLMSQMGYLLMGLGLPGETGLAAGILLLAHDMLALAAIFCISGVAEYMFRTGDMRHMGGVARQAPLLALLWFVCALSLAGVPPLGGFFARLAMFYAAVEQEAYAIGAVALVTNILVLVPLLNIWNEVFLKQLPEGAHPPRHVSFRAVLPGALLVILVVAFGLGITLVTAYTSSVAAQVLDVPGYVSDVTQNPFDVNLEESPAGE